MNTLFLASTMILSFVALGATNFNEQGSSPTLNLCQGHGGLGQAQGVGRGPFQQLGYECKDGFGGKVGIR